MFVLVTSIVFIQCDDGSISPVESKGEKGRNGVVIINEGNYLSGNASISFFDKDSLVMHNDVFYHANSTILGDVAQSMVSHDSIGYVVVNNSGLIYSINLNDFTFIDKIEGIYSPRYICITQFPKAYVSALYDTVIHIVDIETMSITGSIPTGNSSEKMIKYNDLVIVASWMYNNKVYVINAYSDQVIATIEVGKQPNSLAIDNSNRLWVLCDGGYPGSSYGNEPASLHRINLSDLKTEKVLEFHDIKASPGSLNINEVGDSLYFLNRGVFKMGINDASIPLSPFISKENNLFYGLNIDNQEGIIFVSDAVDYQQKGIVYRYKLDGTQIDSYRAGINPSFFYFLYE